NSRTASWWKAAMPASRKPPFLPAAAPATLPASMPTTSTPCSSSSLTAARPEPPNPTTHTSARKAPSKAGKSSAEPSSHTGTLSIRSRSSHAHWLLSCHVPHQQPRGFILSNLRLVMTHRLQPVPRCQEGEVMPYDRASDLPDSVRNVLPAHAQDIYKEAFNSAWD